MGMLYADAPIILRDFLNYMETIKGKSQNTVKEYYYDLRLFLKFFKVIRSNNNLNFSDIDSKSESGADSINTSDITIEDIKTITLSDLYSYMSYLARERGLNSSSRARKVASLRSFMKYLHDKAKLLDYNPAAELDSPKITKSLPKYLNVNESMALLESVTGEHKERDYAILTFFLNCGLRLTELVNINISQINNNKFTVIGKGAKERTIYLNEACIAALNDYMKVRPADGVKDKNALFLSERKQRISNKTVQYIVKKYIKLSGLDPERYSTHKLRHTAATLMYKYGKVDIRALQEILGHESISTTEIYTHVDSSQLREAIDNNPLSKVKKK